MVLQENKQVNAFFKWSHFELNMKKNIHRKTYPSPDGFTGSWQGQPAPPKTAEVEATAVASLRVRSTEKKNS